MCHLYLCSGLGQPQIGVAMWCVQLKCQANFDSYSQTFWNMMLSLSLSLSLSLRVCNSESCGRWLCIATVSHSYKQQSIDRYKKPCRADVWGTHILLMPTSSLVNLGLQPIAKLSGDSGPWWYRWWLQGDIRSPNNLVLGHSNKGFCLDRN
jgi:hypothetical protein